LYTQFFEQVLPILTIACIMLGLLLAGYSAREDTGAAHRGMRRVALAGILSVLGSVMYVAVPVWLDSVGLSPTQGHLRFYGLFFIPVGALAGVLAVMVGSSRRRAPQEGKSLLARFSAAEYAIGYATLWPVFVLYSWIVLGTTMMLGFALIRATATVALGALLFAVAPYFVHVAEPQPRRRLPA
jgi:hypothetical protein